jgi:hypothetical protein
MQILLHDTYFFWPNFPIWSFFSFQERIKKNMGVHFDSQQLRRNRHVGVSNSLRVMYRLPEPLHEAFLRLYSITPPP